MEEALGAGWTVAGGIYILSRPPSFDNPRRTVLPIVALQMLGPLYFGRTTPHNATIRTASGAPVLLGNCEFNVGFHGKASFNREELSIARSRQITVVVVRVTLIT